jgi:predicted DNA-binding antitoxin AbrB/MazE fold protein
MIQHIDAIYDDGVLKPLVPLSLPDKARVKLTVETQTAPDTAEAREKLEGLLLPVREAFEASGLSEDEAVELFEAEKHALRRERRAPSS